MEKKCLRCKQILAYEFFANNKKAKDGLQCWCKQCRKEYRLENIERYKEKDKERYLNNKDLYKKQSKERREKIGKEAIKKYNVNYWKKNKDKLSKKNKEWRKVNKEKYIAAQKNYYIKNKEIFYQNNRKKWLSNPEIVLEACRRRTAKKLNAVPKWANMKLINEFYLIAKKLTEKTGIQHQVDHIVPLQSKLVCGLHVEHNLQVITQSENSSKGNRWWPQKP